MPIYHIQQYELHYSTYAVEADDEADAILKVDSGQGDRLDDGPEYCEVAETYGMPTEELSEECYEALRERRPALVEGDYVPGIRSVSEVDDEDEEGG